MKDIGIYIAVAMLLVLAATSARGAEGTEPYLEFTGPNSRNLATDTGTQTTVGKNNTIFSHRHRITIENTDSGTLVLNSVFIAPVISLGIFNGANTPCTSVLLVADSNNKDTLWVNPTGISAAVVGSGLPLYPGTNAVFRAPNPTGAGVANNCDSIKIIAGPNCGSICQYYVTTQ